MPVRQSLVASLVVAVVLMTQGCGDSTPTEPGAAVFAKGRPTKVALANLRLETTTLPLEGLAVNYTVDIQNTWKERVGVILQGEITQGAAFRGAGGTNVDCGAGSAVLPRGTCAMAFTAQASNLTGGDGTLVAGQAMLVLKVLLFDGSELAGLSVPITLQ